ncbi:tripartite-type tricarboxylate transporter receptor subunit TctC [Variovorax boronicumulans]|uniref:Tripartite-type tricarboxylate transporter receptor subunit TctC n=2 Tax=Variovorax boronicumulans TaxID=436515 RepID=A0AAW8DWJ4_9BURK|nr:tripartite tricarboxylate transporter substrate binding protein [Variovorax boronicumulans]MDP9878342.1 tripartite-type tricarboxylate transporter receptor subunit TctC [Variovorax boronicumulans]MDP9916159.1 tripartite-type tricarboxylate transporter receptor subunit TctC [Variovorax boronicumulans]MDP9923654.1 tripartite-type tricarboxylate transporter receptor subunit TctC [Variovorax boronicumulans]PBI94062.1 Tripartite tricarboxylate transporter family receptor [Variovorax boronicumulan
MNPVTLMQRRFSFSLLAAAALAMVLPAHAQSDAHKQLSSDRFTIVSPFPPGGPVDTLARILSDGLAKRYGQAAVVENMVGAAGNIGIDKVKRAKGDGHTLLVVPAGNLTINPTLMPNFPFNIEKDFVPVTMLAKAPNVLVAAPSSGIKSAKELVAMAKAKPNTLSYASPGVGSGLHLAGELFKQQAGIDLLHVPYKGTAPALNDVLGGSVPLMFSNLPATMPFIKNGKLIALGVTEAKRSAAAPDIPTLAEQGIQGVAVTSWYGLLAPKGTPPAVVEQLAKDAAEMLAQPDVRERLKAQGMTDAAMKPAEFATHIRDETAVWARIIKARNIVAE